MAHPGEGRRGGQPEASLDGFHRRRLLIIEDDVDSADSLKELIQVLGHDAAVAHDGISGIALARELRPEILICDIGMPLMDGFEVARCVRTDPLLRDVVLVALTGFGRAEDRERALEAGYDRHVIKPLDLEDIEQVLEATRRPSP